MSLNPSPDVRRLLRGLAANSPDPDGWWSRDELAAVFPADFASLSPQQVAAAGRQATERGMAFARPAGRCRTHAYQRKQWRIRSLGLGLVSDSCIGGGLKWARIGGVPRCPACLTPAAQMPPGGRIVLGVTVIPAHPLPGHLPAARSA